MNAIRIRLFLFFITLFLQAGAQAANLVEVFKQALLSDPTYQQAIAQRSAIKEGVPLSIAAILPNIDLTMNPHVTRSGFSGTDLIGSNNLTFSPRNNTTRAYTMRLTLTQTIFDFSKFYKITGEVATSKAADATLNASLQDLIVRVASAYFSVLNDEDNVTFALASKTAFKEQLDLVKQQFNVGLKTITDVYTAEASYSTAVATYIAAKTTLTNDKENLRVMTGIYYPTISALNEKFPLISPQPQDIEAWVKKAISQNWAIKAAQYELVTARQLIKQNLAGHLPTLEVQGVMDRQYSQNINSYRVFVERNGPGTQTDRQLSLNINVPIFSGGATLAATKQATYHFEAEQQRLEKVVRDTVNTTRQSYLAILAGVSQIKADLDAVKSAQSSAAGLEESYQVGAETLVNVLTQQQKVYDAQTAYAKDKYAFINNIFLLKQAAGVLSFEDVLALNEWLIEKKPVKEKPIVAKKRS